jgi:hypothetical protein
VRPVGYSRVSTPGRSRRTPRSSLDRPSAGAPYGGNASLPARSSVLARLERDTCARPTMRFMHQRPPSPHQRGRPSIILQPSPAVIGILRRCYSHVEALDRHGNPGLGVTNVKRVFGRPSELRVLVEATAATVQHADAIASVDPGSAPLAAVVAYHLRLPAVFVRTTPKRHFLSYGGDPSDQPPTASTRAAYPRQHCSPDRRPGPLRRDPGIGGDHPARGRSSSTQSVVPSHRAAGRVPLQHHHCGRHPTTQRPCNDHRSMDRGHPDLKDYMDLRAGVALIGGTTGRIHLVTRLTLADGRQGGCIALCLWPVRWSGARALAPWRAGGVCRVTWTLRGPKTFPRLLQTKPGGR